jgi:hypothetical protein
LLGYVSPSMAFHDVCKVPAFDDGPDVTTACGSGNAMTVPA